MKTEQFLEFNGKKLTLVNEEGKFFVALKPICDVLQIDWESQRKAIRRHKIFNSVAVILTATGSDKKQYEMLCLPERKIYLWLGSLNPKTDELVDFQNECADILYSHFHNLLAVRHNDLDERTLLREQHHQLHIKKLAVDDDYKTMVEIQQKLKAISKNLIEYDNILLNGQLKLEL